MKNFSIVLLAAMLFCTLTARAQQGTLETRGMAIYLQLAGEAPALSLNFDTRFAKKQDGLGAYAGFGGFMINDFGYVNAPVGLNYLFGKKEHHFEVGAGGTLIYNSNGVEFLDWNFETDLNEPDAKLYGTLSLGYRYQQPGGVFFRVHQTTFIQDGIFWPFWVGIGVGYSFK